MHVDHKKDNRGGARLGAGRKAKFKIPGEKKNSRREVRAYPSQLAYIEMLYGSLQGLVDSVEIPNAVRS
jgi:hypothetical protein